MSIIAVGGDYGGAAALVPVIQALRARSQEAVRAIAYGQATAVWSCAGLDFDTMGECTADAVDAVLAAAEASVIVTGTSMNGVMLEQQFVRTARSRGLPSVAVLDAWINYRERFVTADGTRCVPDRIAVMDETARAEMVEAGFDPATLVITGQPAFDDLPRWADEAAIQRARELRRLWGVAPDARAVLFASQPLIELYGGRDDHAYFGYDEQTVLRLLISSLEEISRSASLPITLVIRPHPREDREPLQLASAVITVLVNADGHGRDAALAADLVTGMTSTLLQEACYLQRITVSLQPGLRRPDVLQTNRLGHSQAVYDTEEVPEVLRRALLDEDARSHWQDRLRSLSVDGLASQRVIALLDNLRAF